MNFLFVACGGFIGSILRSYLSTVTYKSYIGTWIANVSGSAVLAICVRLYIEQLINEELWLLFGIGFCGAYTTFSTFSYEAIQLIHDRNYVRAIAYIVSSIGVSIGFVSLVLIL
ncbi:fluoride efflux transporter FluC [Virgibacillus sp. W0430]|uniref:fluoride efflux transporter FluC n=1 Tax=Virgibacillus sp. W0430 TaxID=3391580 RepID=UPI003F48B1F8